MSLATIEKIEEVRAFPDPEVNRIEIARVLNYECVVQKDTFKVGDVVVFIYPDSVLPDASWATVYKKSSKNRVKTIKIRSFLSFGIIETLQNVMLNNVMLNNDILYEIGQEVSQELGITKYIGSVPKDIKIKSSILPFHIPITDETRWQSERKLSNKFGKLVDVSLKIDGSSVSYFYNLKTEEFGCTSRKCELKLDSENVYTMNISRYNIDTKLKEYCEKHNVSLCLRGEVYGQSVQNFNYNYHCKLPVNVAFFSVWNIDTMSYEGRDSKHYYVNVCKELNLPIVEMLEENVPLTQELINKYDNELKEVCLKNEKSIAFEGIVIKGSDFSFKVINKHYDMRK